MRWLAFALVLKAALCSAASLCPDPRLREAGIGGDAINGFVVLHKRPLSAALVRLYASVGVAAWVGFTDKNGEFTTTKLPLGVYRLEIDGWGSTNVRLDPNLDKRSNGQVPTWWLSLMDDGCVGAGMSLD